MKVERIVPIPLSIKQANEYAVKAAELQFNKKIVKSKNLGGGSFGRAFETTFENGQKIVVKLLRAKDMLAKEVHDLSLLRKNCTIKVPEVLFSRQADNLIPIDCYAMERIDGKNAFMAFGMLITSKHKRKDFAEKIAVALHDIHKCRNNCFGDTMNPVYSDWLDCYKPFAKEVLDKAEEMYASGKLSEKIITAMRTAWDKFDIIFSEKVQEACLIHGDLNIANIMVNKKYQITGFIDPLNSMYADREYDLFQFNNLTGKRFFLCDTYKTKYGASKYCDQKLAFYGLWNEVFCYIKSGMLINIIMNPLVKNMHKRLKEL